MFDLVRGDASAGDTSHRTFAKERQQVVLAQREDVDVANDDHFVVILVKHGIVDDR